jgi:4-alpha-glucanotransferase
LALAVSGSHDLPTLRGWWQGSDLGLKARLDLFPNREEAVAARERRERDRACLLAALRELGLLARDAAVDWRALVRPVHEFLARSSAALALAQIEDVTGECDPTNVPGTLAEYPNWRRRLCIDIEDLVHQPAFGSVVEAFRQARNARDDSRAPAAGGVSR